MSRNSYVRAHVNLTRLNKIEATYKVSLKGKVERGSTFAFTRDLSHISSILFIHLKITRQWKSTLILFNSF